MKQTSYRSTPVPSESMYGEVGYWNRFGGFHGTTDPYAYLGLFWLLVKSLRHPKTARWIVRLLRDRWRHRKCDTVDFHHDIYCTLDKFSKKMDDEYRWKQVWTNTN